MREGLGSIVVVPKILGKLGWGPWGGDLRTMAGACHMGSGEVTVMTNVPALGSDALL